MISLPASSPSRASKALHHERRVGGGENAVAGKLHNLVVSLVIELEILMALAFAEMAFHALVEAAQRLEIRRRHALHGKFAGDALETTHYLEELADFLSGDFRDTGPAVGQQLDQSLGGQDLERLAHRCPRDSELLAERAFGDPLAGAQLAFDNHVAQLVDGVDEEGLAANGAFAQNGHDISCLVSCPVSPAPVLAPAAAGSSGLLVRYSTRKAVFTEA
jgi:hypothetical protein